MRASGCTSIARSYAEPLQVALDRRVDLARRAAELLGERDRLFEEPVRRDDPVDRAERVRLLERHRLAEKRPARERLVADRGAKSLDAVPRDVDAEPHLGKSDRARPRGREAEVRGAREQRAAGDGVARQRRDERLAEQEQVEEERVEDAHEAAEVLGAGLREPPEVEPAAEDLRRSGTSGRRRGPPDPPGPPARPGAAPRRTRSTGRSPCPRPSARIRMPPRSSTRRSFGASSTGTAPDGRSRSCARFSHAAVLTGRPPERNRSRTRGSFVSSGWNVAAVTLPLRTSTGSPSRRASTSTVGSTAVILGARMKTASSGSSPRTRAREVRQPHDGRVQLTAVRVPHDGHREEAEALPRRPFHVAGEENRSRAGAEDRVAAAARRCESRPRFPSPPSGAGASSTRRREGRGPSTRGSRPPTRTSRAATPARSSASWCASKSPCRARTPIKRLPAAGLEELGLG